MRTLRNGSLILSVALSACGYTDAGSGSETLEVQAIVGFTAGQNNASRIEVTVRDTAGDLVSDAVVTLTDGENTNNTFTIPYDSIVDRYERSDISGYRRYWVLDVERGNDALTAQLEGPGTHAILSPQHNATLTKSTLGEHLPVSWKAIDGLAADEVVIRAGSSYQNPITNDRGSINIPTRELRDDSVETISVERRNRLKLAGALADSRFEIQYTARNTVKVQP